MTEPLLGKQVDYPGQYSPQLLVPIPREPGREKLGIAGKELPFHGADIWNAYELSWLDPRGKPEVAIGQLSVPVDSVNLFESKSLKLYFNSLNQERYTSRADVQALITRDLSAIAGSPVQVVLSHPGEDSHRLDPLPGISLDTQSVTCSLFQPAPELLQFAEDAKMVRETLHTDLFRSNCPVTSQPDWASMCITYSGRQLSRPALLQYLVSYRQHNDYHEHCVEAIFMDISRRCQPEALTVQAHFLRRGGIDINPIRSSGQGMAARTFSRAVRQ
ncbi:MAG: NADPH-dependent 7-cyano-7-deazaguanine reductase QueF [Pseudomonadales bacterium]|nr:NADPH-dependent 7-cyano-7-deazaguanine reductase QueF [Pseudomonadales bacterium]